MSYEFEGAYNDAISNLVNAEQRNQDLHRQLAEARADVILYSRIAIGFAVVAVALALMLCDRSFA
jgi:hypothetical protein